MLPDGHTDGNTNTLIAVFPSPTKDEVKSAVKSETVRQATRNSVGNESVPIQLAQCRYPGLAISKAKILIYFSKKIRKQFYKTALGNRYVLKLPK